MRRLLWVLVFAGFAACGSDSTGPHNPLTLRIAGTVVAPGHLETFNGTTYYVCTVRFDMTTAGGTSGDLAGWSDSEIDYRLTATGQTSTVTISSSTLQDWFGSSTVFAGSQKTTTQGLGWTSPWTASVVFRYVSTVAGIAQGQTATIPVSCP